MTMTTARVVTLTGLPSLRSVRPPKGACAHGSLRWRRSRFLDRDGLDGMGDVFEGVGSLLEPIGNLAELDHGEGVVVATEKTRQELAIDPVRLVLQAVDLDPVRLEVLQSLQPAHRVGRLLRCAGDER